MMKDVFEAIAPACTTKVQQKLIAKLQKKFSLKSSADLWNCDDLFRSFYITGHHKEIKEVMDALLDDLAFTGNFNLWPEGLLALAYQIADEEGDAAFKQRIHDKFCEVEAYEPPPGKICSNKQYLAKRSSKDRVTNMSDKIQKYAAENDVEMEQSSRAALIIVAAVTKAVSLDKNPALTAEMNGIIAEQLEILKDRKFEKYI